MLEVVAGIGDHEEIVASNDAAQSEHELAAADAAPQRHHPLARAAHRNKPSSAGRTKPAAGEEGCVQVSPRTSTAGWASSDCPISRDAALATSSAKPVCVTRSA